MDDSGAVAPSTRVGAASPLDAVLVAMIGQGHTDALGILYDRYGRHAWSLARGICHDDVLAEDAVHDAFVAVWREAARFDNGRSRVSSWLLVSVYRRAVEVAE